ncbi:glycoside hydrolase family 71 protein [Marasmius fiardii PR-910]|nr:glycoside hydrolase family 71 protein [Marasmius fiardii PR-910]
MVLAVFLSASAAVVNAQTVVAHYMAQNAFSYVQSDWAADIKAAQAIGIDGFALNVAVDDYEVGKMPDAFRAAEAANFKLFFSFDMSYDWNKDNMVSLVKTYSGSSAMFKWKGKVLVSTFNGGNKGNDWWLSFKSDLNNQGVPVSFAPAFIDYRDPGKASQLTSVFTSVDGFFNWWSWPEDVPEDLTTATDLAYKQVVSSRGGPYIMSVSPWQFKELGGTQNWVEQSDQLWKYRWEQAINDVKPDIVEIITWNDYGESHYIADINPKVNLGDLAPKYVLGFEHGAWRTVAQYYISWFKSGHQPTITEDKVVFWYRAYPKNTQCAEGDRPRNADYPADAVMAFSMLTSPATIQITIGGSLTQFNASAGVAIGTAPFPSQVNVTPSFKIVRNGITVKSGSGAKAITDNCPYYNFNPTVGSI